MSEADEVAECRGCRCELRGKPYYMGGSAYRLDNGKQAKVNHYGGFVCSPECDFRASLQLEQTMPGHDAQQHSLGCYARAAYERNWKE